MAAPEPGAWATYQLSGEPGNSGLMRIEVGGMLWVLDREMTPHEALSVRALVFESNENLSSSAPDEEHWLVVSRSTGEVLWYAAIECYVDTTTSGCDRSRLRIHAPDPGPAFLWGASLLWGKVVAGPEWGLRHTSYWRDAWPFIAVEERFTREPGPDEGGQTVIRVEPAIGSNNEAMGRKPWWLPHCCSIAASGAHLHIEGDNPFPAQVSVPGVGEKAPHVVVAQLTSWGIGPAKQTWAEGVSPVPWGNPTAGLHDMTPWEGPLAPGADAMASRHDISLPAVLDQVRGHRRGHECFGESPDKAIVERLRVAPRAAYNRYPSTDTEARTDKIWMTIESVLGQRCAVEVHRTSEYQSGVQLPTEDYAVQAIQGMPSESPSLGAGLSVHPLYPLDSTADWHCQGRDRCNDLWGFGYSITRIQAEGQAVLLPRYVFDFDDGPRDPRGFGVLGQDLISATTRSPVVLALPADLAARLMGTAA